MSISFRLSSYWRIEDQHWPTFFQPGLSTTAESTYAQRSLRFYRMNVTRPWFNDHDTVVCPVNGCESVINHTRVFNDNSAIVGLEAIGIVDRDYRPDSFLSNLPANITVLDVHELEGHFCRFDIFAAVAKHLRISATEIQPRYAAGVKIAKQMFSGVLKNKQVLIRAKQRMDQEIRAVANPLTPSGESLDDQRRFSLAYDVEKWTTQPATIYQDELTIIKNALAGSDTEFLEVLPSKPILGILSGKLEIKQERYVELVCSGLSSANDNGENATELEKSLEEALLSKLPARRV